MRAFRDDAELVAELAALRPAPERGFAFELDERVAAGFPRRSRGESPLASLLDRLRETPRRRIVLPAAASALAAVAIATAVVAISQPGGERSAGSKELGALPNPHGSVQFPAPAHRAIAPSSAPSAAAGAASNSGHAAAGSASSQEAEGVAPAPESGPFAVKAPHREVERSAEIVLGADPADVRRDAAKVFDAVHANDGIVLDSSISDGGAGEAAARFSLLIPAGKLGDALADLSRIGEVRARRDTSADITAPIVGLGERLQDSRARIEGLLAQLASAETDAERAAVEVELGAERRQAAALRARLTGLHRRAHLAQVSLRIESGEQASPGGGSGSSWGIGDALHDAGRILAIAAGVTLLALAVLTPLALIALLAWLATRTLLRRGRERALG